jgi:hypothetical protein
MLILECSQGCYGRTDGSVTISLHNFVGEGITTIEQMRSFLNDMELDTKYEPHRVTMLASSVVDCVFEPN